MNLHLTDHSIDYNSRIDYCNIVYTVYTGLPALQLNRLQSVINAAARLITSSSRYSSITPSCIICTGSGYLRGLSTNCACWSTSTAPLYLSDKIQLVASEPSRRKLRSSSSLKVIVPATRTKLGERSFVVAGPMAWNRLPESVRAAQSLELFKEHLKTHLFSISYNANY